MVCRTEARLRKGQKDISSRVGKNGKRRTTEKSYDLKS